jgi:hypothetical protein
VAPGTVVDHWYAETQKYIDSNVIIPYILISNNVPPPESNLWLVTYS